MYKRDLRKQGMQQYNIGGPLATQPIQGVAAPPAVPVQKDAMSQFGDMAKQRLMTTALDKGMDKGAALISSAVTPAATTGAGAGAAMTGLSTAMPYVGMGLLGAKMLGLFSKGGKVGPLAKATYAANGEKVTAEFDKVPNEVLDAIKKDKYYNKEYGRKNLSDGYTLRHDMNKLFQEKNSSYRPTDWVTDSADMHYGTVANRLIDEGLQRERLINFLRSQMK